MKFIIRWQLPSAPATGAIWKHIRTWDAPLLALCLLCVDRGRSKISFSTVPVVSPNTSVTEPGDLHDAAGPAEGVFCYALYINFSVNLVRMFAAAALTPAINCAISCFGYANGGPRAPGPAYQRFALGPACSAATIGGRSMPTGLLPKGKPFLVQQHIDSRSQ